MSVGLQLLVFGGTRRVCELDRVKGLDQVLLWFERGSIMLEELRDSFGGTALLEEDHHEGTAFEGSCLLSQFLCAVAACSSASCSWLPSQWALCSSGL